MCFWPSGAAHPLWCGVGRIVFLAVPLRSALSRRISPFLKIASRYLGKRGRRLRESDILRGGGHGVGMCRPPDGPARENCGLIAVNRLWPRENPQVDSLLLDCGVQLSRRFAVEATPWRRRAFLCSAALMQAAGLARGTLGTLRREWRCNQDAVHRRYPSVYGIESPFHHVLRLT